MRPRPWRRSRLAATASAVFCASAALAPAAAAHTHLAGSAPRDGARTGVAPRAIVLRFTEPVDARTAVIRIVDERGAIAPTAAPTAGATGVVQVAPLRRLGDGDYAVGYRVLGRDGHAMTGGLAFAVAARAAAGAPAPAARVDRAGPGRAGSRAPLRTAVPRDAVWTRPGLAAARAGQYAGIVLALGGVAFLLLAWWPALALAAGARADPAAATWARTLRAGVAIGAASAAAGIALHAFDAAGADPTAARLIAGLGDHAAVLWAEALVCWAAAALLLRRRTPLHPHAAKRLLAPLTGALLATALSGHGGADGNLTATAAAVVHGMAAAIWIGALAWLMLAARRGDRRPGTRETIVPGAAARVSRLALACAVATLASGAVAALALAGGPLTLADSGYGRLVLLKVGLFAALVALGALQRRRSLPSLRCGAAARPLSTTLRAELAIAVLVLGAAGILTGSAPPRPAAAPASTALAADAR